MTPELRQKFGYDDKIDGVVVAAIDPEILPARTRNLISRGKTRWMFSLASIWEVSIKHSLGREDFRVEPRSLRDGLLAAVRD